MRSENLERSVGVGLHVGLARDLAEQSPVGVDDERPPLRRQRAGPFHPEPAADASVGVGEQRKTELVLVIELALPINLIGADSHSSGAELIELGAQVAEMTALLGSARCHCLRVEEQDDRPFLDQGRESDLGAVLIAGREVVDDLANLHASESTILPGEPTEGEIVETAS